MTSRLMWLLTDAQDLYGEFWGGVGAEHDEVVRGRQRGRLQHQPALGARPPLL